MTRRTSPWARRRGSGDNPGVTRVVLLHHTLPDAPPHYDWLIERGAGGACATWRVVARIDGAGGPPPAAFRAERLADHRAHYLTHEGPVSGGRGEVRRAASGECRVFAESAQGVEAVVAWSGGGVVADRGEATGDGTVWAFRASSVGAQG